MTDQQTSAVREVVIAADDAGQRIDNFLQRTLKGVPKSRIYRILRKGEVRVNRGRTKPEYRLQTGDRVRIPPIRQAKEGETARPGNAVLDRLSAAILHEDDRLLVLNKPSGIAVHGGSGLSYGVIEALRAMRPGAPFLELVHRLDRDTSGCLLIAKKRSTLRLLHDLLRADRGMDKRYLALVMGQWRRGGKVEAPLRKNVLASGERIVRVADDGKPALTLFQPVNIYNDATLVEARLMTGRTHQVRVHAQHAGHPIAGDEKYGDGEFNRLMSERGLRRLFLHASELTFSLPGQGDYHFSAPLEPALAMLLQNMESNEP